MDTRNVDDLFNDDFADIFSGATMEIDDFENSQESLSTFIRLLESEKSIQKRVYNVQDLVKFLPTISMVDMEDKLLRYLMPATKELLDDVFREILKSLPTTNATIKSSKTLNFLQEYLRMCVVIYEALDCILERTLQSNEINLLEVQSVPLNVLYMLLVTFQHCKESDELYKIYIDDLKEILLLFKAAQDVHVKLLKLLNTHVNLNELLDNQIILLKNVLETLGEIGEVLVDTNIKALADNWKGYMTLTQKIADILNKNSFDISRSLRFLSSEISRNLSNVLKMDANDQTGSEQILKICNFFLRVALKLCDTFWPSIEGICASVFDFFVCIYNFYPPFLQFKGYPESRISQINSSVFICFDSLLNKFVCEPEFFKVCAVIKTKEINASGLLFFLMTVFQRLAAVTRTNEATSTWRCKVHCLIELFFEVVKESYSELFLKMKICSSKEKRSIYDENVINISVTILSLDGNEYKQIQVILFKNILQESIWSALLATDVWCSVLRLQEKRRELSYETLCQVVTKTEDLLLNNFTDRPEKVFLENFLQRVYASLSAEQRSGLVEKYPLPSNLHIWKTFGFKDFPQAHSFMIESLLINIVEKMEGLKGGGKCSLDDFKFLCNGLEALSSLSEENFFNLGYLCSVVVKLWNFESSSGLLNNALFKRFLQKLCGASNNFMGNFNNKQLLVILSKLKQLLNAGFNIKLQAVAVLRTLATKSFADSPESTQITTILSEIFRFLLQDKNPIVKQNALEVFFDFISATPHEEIPQNTVKNSAELHELVSNFIHRNIGSKGMLSADEYFAKQKTYKFQHECLNLSIQEKSVKSDISEMGLMVKRSLDLSIRQKRFDDDEIQVVLKRIKGEVEHLHKLCGKEDVAQKNVNEIVSVLSRQLDYRC